MINSFAIKILLGLSAVVIIFFFTFNIFKEEKKTSIKIENEKEDILEDIDTTTNIIKDVNYRSNDVKGNEYFLNASEGQIDLTNNKVIFLTNVKATITMVNGDTMSIKSDYGKYNINKRED